MTDPRWRVKAGDPDFGPDCPRCHGPKALQARKCRECHDELWRGLHAELNIAHEALRLLYAWAEGDNVDYREAQRLTVEAMRLRDARSLEDVAA